MFSNHCRMNIYAEKSLATPVAELVDNGEAVVTDRVGTNADQLDMFRMGKVQQMQRIFRLFPMVSFSIILMASWEIALGASVISIYNGGLAGTIYMYIVCWIGFLAVYSSMAEMGSMAPTSGGGHMGNCNRFQVTCTDLVLGQYHWVSEFAPAGYQKILSYFVGWLRSLG